MAVGNQSGQQIVPMSNARYTIDNGGPQMTAMNITIGTFTANSGTPVVVAQPAITTTSQIDITLKTVGGTPAGPFLTSITPGTGFTVNSGASDTSVYNYSVTG